MNLRKFFILIIVISLVFSIVACGGSDKGTGGKQTGGEETEKEFQSFEPKGKIKIWSGIQDTILDEFCIEYPDVEIEKEAVASPFDIDKSPDLQRLAASVASKEQPDVMMCMMTPAEAYYSNLFQPITEYLEKDVDYNLDDIDPGAFDLTTFNEIPYFVPVDFTVGILVWNKDLLERVGMDPEKPPTTWDEFYSMCEKCVTTKPSGKIDTIGMEHGALPWENWHLASFGKHWVDETGLNVNFNTDEYLKVIEFSKNLENHYGGGDKLGTTSDYRFIFGTTAFSGWNGAALNSLTQYAFDFDFGTFPVVVEGQKAYIPAHIGASYGIPKGAQNPVGGWKLGTYHVTTGRRKNEIVRFTETPDDYIPGYNIHRPSREKLYEDMEGIIDEGMLARMKKRDEIESKRDVVAFTFAEQSKLRIYINEEYPKVISGDIAPKDFLENLQKHAETLIEDFKKQKTEEGWVFEEGKAGIPPKTEQ